MSLPPSTTKGSNDSSKKTTFNLEFPNNPITHNGVTATLGITAIAGGGTGADNKAAAFDNLAPTTTKGDIISFGVFGNTRQAAPGPGEVLTGDTTSSTGLRTTNLAETDTLRNILFYATPTGGQMRVGLSTLSNAAHTTILVGKIMFRSATAAMNLRTITAEVVETFPAGATFGRTGPAQDFYAYAIDNAGTVTVGISGSLLDETALQTVTQASATSIDRNQLYANVPTGSYAIRLVGKFRAASSATPATWTTAELTVAQSIGRNTTPAAVISPFVGEWRDYSHTISATGAAPTLGATSINKAQWRRLGPDSIEVKYDLVQTSAGTGGSGNYLFSLPPGFSIDQSKQQITPLGAGAQIGTGYISAQSDGVQASSNSLTVHAYSATTVLATGLNSPAQGAQSQAPLSSGYFSLAAALIRLSLTYRVPVTQYASAQGATLITKDPVTSMASVLATGTRVTTTPANLGEYRSYVKSANTDQGTDSAPAAAPSAANGMQIYGNLAYAAAGTAGQITRWEIFVGRNKQAAAQFFATTGKTGLINTNYIQVNNNVATGIKTAYDPATGIFLIDGSAYGTGAENSRNAGIAYPVGAPAASQAFAYFDIFVYDNPLAAGLSPADNIVRLSGATTFGTTDTRIFYFPNVVESRGSAVTVSSTAATGTAVTINEDGWYSISANDGISNVSANMGISRNADATQRTTAIYAATLIPVRLAMAYTPGINPAAGMASVSWSGPLKKGDVIRPHGEGGNARNADWTTFSISKAPSPFEVAGQGSAAAPRAEVIVYGNASGTAGAGTANTRFRRFLTVGTTIGTAITYADSAADGARWTINEDGIYDITYTDSNSGGAGALAITKNDTEGNAAADGITNVNNVLGINANAGPNVPGTTHYCGFLPNQTVIRAHCSGSSSFSSAYMCRFQITKVSN